MFKYALLAAFALGFAFPAAAQVSADATHTVTVEVNQVRAIEVGADLTLALTAPVAGDTELAYTGSSTYGVLTNSASDKVTASVAGLVAGLTLAGTYAAPTGATGGTDVALSASAVDIVTGIANKSESGLSIDYDATAALTLAAGTYDLDVTYTILAN